MSFLKILVPVSGDAGDENAMRHAFAAGSPFNAHIIALFPRPRPASAIPYMPNLTEEVVNDLINALTTASDTASAKAFQAVERVCREVGAKIQDVPYKSEGPTCSFVDVEGDLQDILLDRAKLTDLVVFAPLATHTDNDVRDQLPNILLKAGCPVLIAAEHLAGRHFGQKIAIAWDGSFAAAHALKAAMPYLLRSDEIEIIQVQKPPLKAAGSDEVRDHLNFYGLSCTIRIVNVGTRDVAETLLEAANDGMANLLVMGGYGHSRLRETVFGGTTQYISGHPMLPVLLVH